MRMVLLLINLLLLSIHNLPNVWAAPFSVKAVLLPTLVDSEGDQTVFAVPFDYRNGMLFTAHVEPPAPGDKDRTNLRTVIRKGTRLSNGAWNWEAKVIESRTIRDPFHTQPSIALDSQGYVHVVYNMHNMPWQYCVSQKPFDITTMVFSGQRISATDIEAVKYYNKTSFPDIGTAVIPGNQITYPMFFTDRNKDLYLTYRFALKPARAWEERAFAGAIAKYDVGTKTWHQLGGPFVIGSTDAALGDQKQAVLYPFAFEDTFSVYLITLAFDAKNGMHAFWNWRPGGAGTDTINPSYAYSPDLKNFFRSDGSAYNLPIDFKQAEAIVYPPAQNKYSAQKSVAVLENGKPVVIVQDMSLGRELITLNTSGQWSAPELTPFGASEIIVDRLGRQWSFASGLRVFMRQSAKDPWREYGRIGSGLGDPKVKYVAEESLFIVHAKTADRHKVSMFSFSDDL